MKNKLSIKKIGVLVIAFLGINLAMSYSMEEKIDALEQEKVKLEQESSDEYKGDCSDEEITKINDDIVVKIISKLSPDLDINFVNKFDEVDENNKSFSRIELSVSGDLDKVKEIEGILDNMKLNYKVLNMDIKNRTKENGDKIDNYVDCVMTFIVK